MAHPQTDRLPMRPQPLSIRQRLDNRRNPSQTRPRQPLDTDELHEIQNAQPTPKARSATRRQHMIRTRRIVSTCLWGIVADENRSRVMDKREVRGVNREMFRSDFVCPRKALRARGRNENDAI